MVTITNSQRMDKLPRGISLKNPGNIRISAAPWLGKVTPSIDDEFETFEGMKYGVRAAARIFLEYSVSHGLSTIAQYINRWAPPEDANPTNAYADFVSADCSVDPNNQFNVQDAGNMAKLLASVFRFECGGSYVSDEDMKAGIEMAVSTIS